MSSRTSSRSTLTIVPSTMSPSLKYLIVSSTAARKASSVPMSLTATCGVSFSGGASMLLVMWEWAPMGNLIVGWARDKPDRGLPRGRVEPLINDGRPEVRHGASTNPLGPGVVQAHSATVSVRGRGQAGQRGLMNSRCEECPKRPDIERNVDCAHQLPRRMHRQLRRAHVYRRDADPAGRDGSDGRSARQIGPMHVALPRHAGLVAGGRERRGADGVGGVAQLVVDLEYGPAAGPDPMRRLVPVDVVGMRRVRHVAGGTHRPGDRPEEVLPIASGGQADAPERRR